MAPTGTWFEVEKFDGTRNLGLWQTRMKDLLTQQGCLKALWEVMLAEMKLSCDGWKFMEDDLRASSVSCNRTRSSWVRLDSLTDRRKSVGTEDGGGISEDDVWA